MSFRLPPPSSQPSPEALSPPSQAGPSERPASTTHEPTGAMRPRSSTGPSSAVQRSPLLAPAAPGSLPRERSVGEFPAQLLEVVLRECRALHLSVFSDPPPSIESLSANDLSLLETTLTRRFLLGPHNPNPATMSARARDAVRAWTMVQYARLRCPGSSAGHASLHPEHVKAVNAFLQILHPSTELPTNARTHLTVAFNQQCGEGRIPPHVNAMVEALGIETLAAQGYRLDARTGAIATAAEMLATHVLGLSSTPRARIGNLPDSEQYQRIKSMTPAERTVLESNLESRFMTQAGQPPLEDTLRAVEAWLTTQQVRLRIHSEASVQRHAQAQGSSPVTGLRMAAASLGAARWPSEFSRFHSEHESSNRPEYAIALNNFLRLLRPSSPLPPDVRQRIADRLTHHAEIEGTLSAPVVEVMRQQGPHALAAANWRLDAVNNVFSPPVVAIGPYESAYWWALPAPYMPANLTSTDQPGPDLRG